MQFDKTTQNLCEQLKTHWDYSNVKQNTNGVILPMCITPMKILSVCHILSHSVARAWQWGFMGGNLHLLF